MFFDALSNAACRLSLRGPGTELEGGGQTLPGPARLAPSSGPARVKANCSPPENINNFILVLSLSRTSTTFSPSSQVAVYCVGKPMIQPLNGVAKIP